MVNVRTVAPQDPMTLLKAGQITFAWMVSYTRFLPCQPFLQPGFQTSRLYQTLPQSFDVFEEQGKVLAT